MNEPTARPQPLDAATAATYAAWFKALADPTRVRLVNLLAVTRRPMSVGEIVERSQVGQSTVSHHLKQLAEVRFVIADKRGTSTYYRVNENCLSCFPSAADAVMGHPAPDPAAVPCEETYMSDDDTIKAEVVERVRDRYASAATRAAAGETLIDPCATPVFGSALYDSSAVLGEVPLGAAAASLGCGNPVAVADLHEGETVLDLGSGGGIDVLLSAKRVGATGRAIGLDMTQEMLDLARRHAAEAGAANAEFLEGRIEDIPLPDASVDVVISNCVITLSTDKPRVFREITRVLRPGGRLGISDLVADSEATRTLDLDPTGCAATALTADEYTAQLCAAALTGITITGTHQAGPGLTAVIVRAQRPEEA